MRRDVFQAIADPTRRQILALISGRSMNLNAIAEHFSVSRPAISKHIKILAQCGLVRIKQRGRERYCEARLKKLDEVFAWINKYREFWDQELKDAGTFVQEAKEQSRRRRKGVNYRLTSSRKKGKNK